LTGLNAGHGFVSGVFVSTGVFLAVDGNWRLAATTPARNHKTPPTVKFGPTNRIALISRSFRAHFADLTTFFVCIWLFISKEKPYRKLKKQKRFYKRLSRNGNINIYILYY